MTAVKWDVKLLYYVSTPCNIYTPTSSLTHKHITLAHIDIHTEGVCIIGTSLQWKDMTSISFQMTVVIIRFSSPHHPYLHHLAPIPGSHIRIYEINSHTSTWIHIIICTGTEKANVQQMHSTNVHIHTRPPSCHRAKPPACPTLPLRMFWTSAVMWFSQWCGFVCLCVLICSPVSQGDRSWRRPSDWAVTNPLTTRLTVIGHDHTEGDGVSRW